MSAARPAYTPLKINAIFLIDLCCRRCDVWRDALASYGVDENGSEVCTRGIQVAFESHIILNIGLTETNDALGRRGIYERCICHTCMHAFTM